MSKGEKKRAKLAEDMDIYNYNVCFKTYGNRRIR